MSERTVDWLIKAMYEGMRRVEPGPPWDQLSTQDRNTLAAGLTAALEALDAPCLLKLREGEPIFVLRAQDKVSVPTLVFWFNAALAAGADNDEKMWRAGLKTGEFCKWQSSHRELVKVPD